MPAIVSSEEEGRAGVVGWEEGEEGDFGVGEGLSSSSSSSSSAGERGRRDISTERSRALRGLGAAGVNLLISSPMMARGAQPYMAQDLRGLRVSMMFWSRKGGRGCLRSAEGDEGGGGLERGREGGHDH